MLLFCIAMAIILFVAAAVLDVEYEVKSPHAFFFLGFAVCFFSVLPLVIP